MARDSDRCVWPCGWEKKGAVTTVSKYQARVRKCGVCNGAGRYYPIDEGPLQECQICNGLGLLKVKNDRTLAPSRSRAVKVGQSDSASSSSRAFPLDGPPVEWQRPGCKG